MQTTMITLVLGYVIDFIKDQFAKLATPVSAASKAGVAVGVVAIVVYLSAFYAETPLERSVLLASTIGSLIAGYVLGAKA
jgi:hypothetical protein